MMKLHKDQRKRAEKDSRDRRSSDQDYKDLDLDSNRDINRLEKRKSARKVEDFGVQSGSAPCDDKDALKSEYLRLLVGELIGRLFVLLDLKTSPCSFYICK